MRYFPLFFDLKDRRVIVVGGGEKAAQKLRLLVKTPARLEIVATKLNPEITSLVTAGKLLWVARQFQPNQLDGTSLVYATQDKSENLAVAQAARARNIPVNAVDMPDLCDVITPAIVDRNPVVVAIGTEGCAPVLARRIKSHLEGWLPQNLGAMATTARKLRNAIYKSLPDEKQRRTFWEKFWPDSTTNHTLKGSCQKACGSAEAVLKILKHTTPTPPRGRISLVGTGPGDVDLLTFRALQHLQQADVIVYDSSLNSDILECARREAEHICLNDLPEQEALRTQKISDILFQLATKGRHVAHLNCGTPLVSSPSDSHKKLLTSNNISMDFIPGLPAALKAKNMQDWTSNNKSSGWQECRANAHLPKGDSGFGDKTPRSQ